MYETLILSGGGTAGYIQLGALKELESKLTECKLYVGCSVGSLINLLLIAGFKVDTIIDFASKVTFDKTSLKSILSTTLNYGSMKINPFIADAEKMIINKFGKIPTMEELYRLTQKKMIVCVTNVLDGTLIEISHDTPGFEHRLCTDVIDMSCRIPFIFTPVEGKYIDGGLKCNFPVHHASGKTLAIWTKGKINNKINTFYDYVSNIIHCISEKDIAIADNVDLIDVSYKSTWLIVSPEQRIEMLDIGRTEALKI